MTSLRDSPARLLVADDDKVNRLLLTRSLELQGHSVASATDGKAALAMLAEGGFDLLLLDMEMLEMNGFQVLDRLNADRVLRDLPMRTCSSTRFTGLATTTSAPRSLQRTTSSTR